jgi:plastocyanin domain-containing protein
MKRTIILALGALIINLPVVWAKPVDKTQIVEIQVTEKGFEPSNVSVSPGAHVILKITRKTDATCATQIKIPSRGLKKDLPLNKTISIELGRVEKGEIAFACGEDMMGGHIFVK